jgi:hypothetical protein
LLSDSKKKKFNKKWSISKLKKWSKKSTNNKFDSLGEESLIDIDESNCKYSDASYSDSELDNIPIPNYSCLKKYELLNHFDSLLNNPENKSAYHRGRRQAHVKFPRSISSETSSTDPSTVNGSEATQNCNDEDDYKVSYDDFESDSSSNVSIVTIEDDDYESANLFDNPSICIENIDQMEEGPEKSTDARDNNIEDSDDCIILVQCATPQGREAREARGAGFFAICLTNSAKEGTFLCNRIPAHPNLASAAQEKGQVLKLLREVIDAPRPELTRGAARSRSTPFECCQGWRRLPRRLAQLVLCLVVVLLCVAPRENRPPLLRRARVCSGTYLRNRQAKY